MTCCPSPDLVDVTTFDSTHVEHYCLACGRTTKGEARASRTLHDDRG